MSKTETLGADQNFRARWDGRVDLDSNGSALDIWLGNQHFLPLAGMRFANGQVLLQTSNTPTFETIGSYNESQNHTVAVTIDKPAQKYSIVMLPGSVLSGWRTVLFPEALNTDRPTLYFHFSENKSSPAKYVVDRVRIDKTD
jgi:hypothetical protein